jgi:arsenite methyltransferase
VWCAAITSSLGSKLLDMGFGHPSGLLGRVGGWLMAQGNGPTERHLVEIADLSSDGAVLVLGPGPGVGLHAAASVSRHVVAVDPSEVMLNTCRRRCSEMVENGSVRLVQGDAENTQQPDASVDVVLSVNNVQIWPDWQAGFAELYRVLRPGGRLLLSAHNKWLPGGLDALAAAVEKAGFRETQTWTWEPPGARRPARSRSSMLSRGSLRRGSAPAEALPSRHRAETPQAS